ncbi:hydrogenase expression/formation protein HypE [Candidatus Obscuribacterales bacterium]|nr:hydrogenase expression/formation protein HypE [Candidatus Obscuribacterales bacterium]
MSEQLIERIFLPHLGNKILNDLEDAALVENDSNRVAISTDSFVVKPIFFPGGNIGSLAVHGTVNDLAMRLARPKFLTAAFIIEEGFLIKDLESIVESFAEACRQAQVVTVAADTKVVNKGAGDGVYINTTGIGSILVESPPAVSRAKPGDILIVSGDIGRHGIAVMCARENLEIESELLSDSTCLTFAALELAKHAPGIHVMRDVTRGGLASVLTEIAVASKVGIEIDDSAVPICPEVRGACELLGLDPLYVACEGRFICIVEPSIANEVVQTIKKHDPGRDAVVIGKITETDKNKVISRTAIGGRRLIDKLTGDQLPRIC